MFSVIFPGQGSQTVGMSKDLYDKYKIVKDIFEEANDTLNTSISNIIFNGPKEALDQTENTQPAIFIVGYAIFQLLKKEFNINLNKAKYFAGHSLGEYTALACSESLIFSDTLKLLRVRGKAMQDAIPKGEGGMVAVLGAEINLIEKILVENINQYKCYVANDNSKGQIVVSGKMKDLDFFIEDLKKSSIKNIKLPVSAPFHCNLMNKATLLMEEEIKKYKFQDPVNDLVSNVTGKTINEAENLKKLLIKQIESRVRWRESVEYMVKNGTLKFIEIGPGKVLSGLIKRINKNVETYSINSEDDVNKIKIND
jgi:[acyl-carrier-protein] S-malonyltransferase